MPSTFPYIFRPVHDECLQLTNDLGNVVSDYQIASVLKKAFSNLFPSHSISLLPPLLSSDFFSDRPYFIDYSTVVGINNYLKISSSLGIDDMNSKRFRSTKLAPGPFLA